MCNDLQEQAVIEKLDVEGCGRMWKFSTYAGGGFEMRCPDESGLVWNGRWTDTSSNRKKV